MCFLSFAPWQRTQVQCAATRRHCPGSPRRLHEAVEKQGYRLNMIKQYYEILQKDTLDTFQNFFWQLSSRRQREAKDSYRLMGERAELLLNGQIREAGLHGLIRCLWNVFHLPSYPWPRKCLRCLKPVLLERKQSCAVLHPTF